MTKEEKSKKKWRRRLVNLLILLLFLIGLVLIFNQPIRNFLIGLNQNRYRIVNVTAEEMKKNNSADASFDFEAVQPASFQSVLAAQLSNQALPVIGGVAVPQVGINLPIFRGVSNTSLLYGAGTMKPDQVMGKGNYALASHTVSGFNINQGLLFTPLENVKNGMTVYLTDKINVYQYKVDSVRILNASHVEVINDVPGKIMVTLVTCETRNSPNRIVVQGEFVKEVKFSAATKDMLNAFGEKYNQISR